jgi:hypothetical protein
MYVFYKFVKFTKFIEKIKWNQIKELVSNELVKNKILIFLDFNFFT